MGLQSCKPYNCCLQSKEECRLTGVCPYVCEDWRYCSDRCCDVCCQMCVDLCSCLCSGDCSYSFCTVCLALAQNCLLLFTARQSETSEARPCDYKRGLCTARSQSEFRLSIDHDGDGLLSCYEDQWSLQ